MKYSILLKEFDHDVSVEADEFDYDSNRKAYTFYNVTGGTAKQFVMTCQRHSIIYIKLNK